MSSGTAPTTGYLVWRLANRWRVAVDRALAPIGLTHAQYALLGTLSALSAAGVRPSQRELADRSGLEPIYVSKLARALEAAGILQRPVDPRDPRAVRLTLTEHGQEVVNVAVGLVQRQHAELTEAIGGPAGAANQELRTTLLTLLGEKPVPPNESETVMSTPTVRTLNGRTINLAAAATRSILTGLLDREGVTFDQYATLRGVILLSTPVDKETTAQQVAGPAVDLAGARQALDGLLAKELVAVAEDGVLTATEAGRVLFQRISTDSTSAGDELFAGIPAEDLAVAERVLNLVTDRATAKATAN